MRIMGIDFGSKRVGIALSDNDEEFAFPKTVLDNNKNLIQEIKKFASQNEVTLAVVGESRDYKGAPNEIMKKVVPFVEELRLALNIPVEMELEFMTSAEAERLQGKNNMLDASAAALILKSYLEKKKNKNT